MSTDSPSKPVSELKRPSALRENLSCPNFTPSLREKLPSSGHGSSVNLSTRVQSKKPRPDGKVELLEADGYAILGFSYPTWKKWAILSITFFVQLSMNFNASIYANAIHSLSHEFSISEQAARVGQMIFLIAYAFGSELWAPWSEEIGRWPIMQLSLLLVNLWQIPCALAQNFPTIVVGRFLAGLCSAGGSVTLGMIADMWEPDDQQFAVAFIVLASVAGSVISPIVGGFIQEYLHWRWIFWIQLLFGAAAQFAHFAFIPETRATVILDREAKRRRRAGEANIFGPSEMNGPGITMKEVTTIWARPFSMFVREPIVLCLSLLSGFSDALIFTFLESFQPVFRQWGFSTIQIGLAFIPIMVGYVVGYLSFIPVIVRHRKIYRKDPDGLEPESRLWWLLFTAPLETIGLFGFAWTSLGPPQVHWIAPMLFSMLIAIANYCIYMATIDYMVASYGPYSASATGGNALARDFLAGIAAMYSTPMYESIGHKYKLEWPSTILGIISFFITIPIYIFYWKGPKIRERSKFAQIIAKGRKERNRQLTSEKGTDVEQPSDTEPLQETAQTYEMYGVRTN
ncbi:hypothetical protein FQN55_003826 [Onygenales sp. PD_40]|nr:hypothetical protein FQN55_003826 [Onygenales sp. PD_40]KAK2787581.1 hypothetical protein FQN53_005030 [Emmonsiellopsis sp. PD_33]